MFRLLSQNAQEDVPRALPSSWYREPAMYGLERRAIFSKRWLLITHRSRFIKAGDYVRYEEAGWSYGLGGKLAKAPRFETMPSFVKENNGLFKVHVHVNARGFVWVNLEAADKPSIPWNAEFDGSDTQARLGEFNMDDFSFGHA
ncbi:hypothetical protein QQX98_010298 [Neonectria punicea]|uniref:Uncharacterized protein n=1 Tax=Neonectria punicea TaxID=979145 RepID=A0ABR1GQ96_9HYPO